jgi:CelD/BcsL family acetyltransferase involved in cellulose biosynthesis
MPPEIEWISSDASFADLAPEWDQLAGGSPFDLHCWYDAWWRAFGGEAEMAVCTLRRDGELAGVFPLTVVGGALRAMANVHSPSYRPLARDPEALSALASAVLERGGFELCCLPERDGTVEKLVPEVRAARMAPLLEPTYSSPTVDTSGDVDAWREESKKRWGAPLERFRRKMGRDHEAEFTIIEPPAALDAELADGYRVEASGWKGSAGTAITSSPETEAFYSGVARAFAARDELRFSRIVLDGETAAFDFTLLHSGRLHLLKTGFDERFRKLAPGLVMRLSIVERCFEMGLDSHELLGDESDWKAKFATGTRPHATLRAYGRGPVERARHGYRSVLRPRLRRFYRRLKKRD